MRVREWVDRLRGTLRLRRPDADLEEELRVHLELAAEREQRRGGPADRARRAAVLQSGGTAQTMEALRDQRGIPSIENLRRDFYYAGRAIVRQPGFAAVALLTLGSGLGLCLTVFTVVNAYLIRSMPYPRADRLHSVILRMPGTEPIRNLAQVDWSRLDDVVDHRIAWDFDMFYLLGGSFPEGAAGAWVTPGFVRGLGLRAHLGRVLDEEDFRAGGPTHIMISRRLWRTRFGSDAHIVGRPIKAYVSDRPDEAETLTIVGVMDDFWHFNAYTDVVGPLRDPAYPSLLRLREGVDAGWVADRITALVRSGAANVPESWSARLVAFQDRYSEEMRPLLTAVTLSAVLVLLIACANIAVLLLVRSTRRRHEIAIRLALGASRLRVARSLGLEALLLGGSATVSGVGLSVLLSKAIAPLAEGHFGRRLPGGADALTIDAALLAAALAGGVLLTAALTLAPLVTLQSTGVGGALKAGGRTATEGRTARRLRSALIAGEMAAALTLLVGAALLIRSSVAMLDVDPGFRADGLLTTSVGLRARAYPEAVSRARFHQRLLERVGGHRTGGGAALASGWPLHPPGPRRVGPVGRAETVQAGVTRVSTQYFATLGIPLLDGTTFGAHDRLGGDPVVVISESLARRLWPTGRAVGQELRIAEGGGEPQGIPQAVHRVIGVARDVRQVSYDDGRVQADATTLDAYVPIFQRPELFAVLYVRDFSKPSDALRDLVAGLDSEVAVESPGHVAEQLAASRSGPRELAWMLSSFAAFAAAIALIGIYSVIAYGVRQREREIGIRLVVGADPRAVTRLFVREGTPLIGCGLAAGLLGAVAVGQALRSQLFGVPPTSPWILGSTTMLFAICGWLALWWPARRAAVVDPAMVLKDE